MSLRLNFVYSIASLTDDDAKGIIKIIEDKRERHRR